MHTLGDQFSLGMSDLEIKWVVLECRSEEPTYFVAPRWLSVTAPRQDIGLWLHQKLLDRLFKLPRCGDPSGFNREAEDAYAIGEMQRERTLLESLE